MEQSSRKRLFSFKKILALCLVGVLILLTPGSSCYAALADKFSGDGADFQAPGVQFSAPLNVGGENANLALPLDAQESELSSQLPIVPENLNSGSLSLQSPAILHSQSNQSAFLASENKTAQDTGKKSQAFQESSSAHSRLRVLAGLRAITAHLNHWLNPRSSSLLLKSTSAQPFDGGSLNKNQALSSLVVSERPSSLKTRVVGKFGFLASGIREKPKTPQIPDLKPHSPKKSPKFNWNAVKNPAILFIAALVIEQIGIESQAAVMPALLQKIFGNFTLAAEFSIVSALAKSAGQTVASGLFSRFGLKRTYLSVQGIRIAALSILGVLLGGGHVTLSLLYPFFAASGFLGGISTTAENTIPPLIVGQDPEKLEYFWGLKQFMNEFVGTAAPIAAGALLGSVGYLPIFFVFPVAFTIATLLLLKTLKIPAALKNEDASNLAGLKTKKRGSLGEGAKIFWQNPSLRYSLLGYVPWIMLNGLLYGLFAPAFGIRLAGAGHEAFAANIYGLMTGLYSLGGWISGFFIIRESKKMKVMSEAAPQKNPKLLPQDVKEIARQSMLRWMKWSAISLLAIASFAFPIPTLSHFIMLPNFLKWMGALSVPALALVPFGFTQAGAMIKLQSYMQSLIPKEKMAAAMGFLSTVGLMLGTFGILAVKFLFSGFSLFGLTLFPAFHGIAGFAPFAYVSAAMVPLALFYFRLIGRLRKSSAPENSSPK